jgi:hypothetical protein
LLKGSNTRLPLRIVLRHPHQDPDTPHAVRWLGASHERPGNRAAKQLVELTASDESRHLIPPAGRLQLNDSTIIAARLWGKGPEGRGGQ